MIALLTSRCWPWRIARIAILVALIWWVLKSTGLVYAQLPAAWEWPDTDFEKTTIDLSEIMSGGPPKDGIPAVDEPKFQSVADADAWLDDKEPVIVVRTANAARAYPVQILIWHEIVNDELGGIPLAVTFCPLCNAAIVFDRRVGAQVLDFGTTGRLRKSDLVMYDRQTESWWQQFTGTAIVGKLTGTELTQYPASIVAYADFKAAYPAGDVLSKDTGFSRAYGKNPYRGYDSITDRPFLFRDAVDPRLPPMEYVLSITVDAHHMLYPFSVLQSQPLINDTVEGIPMVVLSREGTYSALDGSSIVGSRTIPSATAFRRTLDGQVLDFELRAGTIVDGQTGSQWDILGRALSGPLQGKQLEPASSGVHFAFAWLAFKPDSSIYGRDAQ